MHYHSPHCTVGMTLEERLLHYLPNRPEGECWLWRGTVRDNGYGALWWDGKNRKAHRVAYEVWVGEIPPGLHVDHVVANGCVSKLCCNPAHLEAVTQRENNARTAGLRGSGPEVCAHGHEWTPANTYWRPDGQRQCRTCNREGVARARAGRRLTG